MSYGIYIAMHALGKAVCKLRVYMLYLYEKIKEKQTKTVHLS